MSVVTCVSRKWGKREKGRKGYQEPEESIEETGLTHYICSGDGFLTS
jgi:hypothetical protein